MDMKKKDRDLDFRTGHSNGIKTLKTTKAASRLNQHNPFGGRRMIFENSNEITDEAQHSVYRNEYKQTYSSSPVQKATENEGKIHRHKKAAAISPRSPSRETRVKECKSEDLKNFGDSDGKARQKHEKSNLKKCNDSAHTHQEIGAKAGKSDRCRMSSNHRQERTKEIVVEGEDKHACSQDEHGNDLTTDFRGVSKPKQQMTPNFLTGRLNSIQNLGEEKSSEKYTILFTNERMQGDASIEESVVPKSDRLACGDGKHLSKSPEPCLKSCNNTTLRQKQRKFVIRREKHEAQSGKQEDATYTIHVCSQYIANTSTELTSNSQGRKKETRGDIFRKNTSLNRAKYNYLEGKCKGNKNELVNEREHRESLAEVDFRKRLSSFSPPKRKRKEEIASQTKRRAQSQHEIKVSTGRGSRSRAIRLIDHLEKTERAEIDAGGECCCKARPEAPLCLLKTARQKVSEQKGKSMSIEKNTCLKQNLSYSPELAAKNANLSREASPDQVFVKGKQKRLICPVTIDKNHIEDRAKTLKPEQTSQINMLTQLIKTEEEDNRLRHEVVAIKPPVYKKDVACQYSPPLPTQLCCPCHCHTTGDMASALSGPVDYSKPLKKAGTKVKPLNSNKCTMSRHDMGQGGNDRLWLVRMNKSATGERVRVPSEEELEEDDEEEEQGEEREGEETGEQKEEYEEESEGEISITSNESEDEGQNVAELDSDDFDGDKGERNQLHRREEYKEGNNDTSDVEDDDDIDDVGTGYSRTIAWASDSSTPTQNVSKNNSATKTVTHRNKNESNSFRDIVEKAKKRSSINVRPLDKNSSGLKKSCRDCDQVAGQDDAGHYFIGDYLFSLWKKQVLCDVRVDVNNSHFLAHKLVLAAFSEIFTPTTPYPEPTLQFTVPNSSPESVYRVFKYIYTASMDVKDNQLEDTLRVGIFLGITEVKDVILEILSRPTFDNVELYIDIQNRCGIPTSLMDYPELYQNKLVQMIHMEKFLQLTTGELEVILRDPNVLVASEVDTLHALATWAQYNPLERVAEVPRLLDFIIFEVISPDSLARIIQLYDPIFAEIGARNKISEVFRFHALQLSNKTAETEGFIEDVPGVVQDTTAERLSFIPSQSALAKYQERPSGDRPSLRKVQTEPNLNTRTSTRYTIRPSTTVGNSNPVICRLNSKSVSQTGCLDRPSAKSDRKSFNFGLGQDVNASNPRGAKGVSRRRKSKSVNRSNNSAINKYEETHTSKLPINYEGVERIHKTSREAKSFEGIGSPSSDNYSDRMCNRRFTRRDHWVRVSRHSGRVQLCPEGDCLRVGDTPTPFSSKDSRKLSKRSELQECVVHSNSVLRHRFFSDCLEDANTMSRYPTSPNGTLEGDDEASTEALPRPHRVCLACSCGFAATAPQHGWLDESARCTETECKDIEGIDRETAATCHFSSKAADNKNSNASSFFDLV